MLKTLVDRRWWAAFGSVSPSGSHDDGVVMLPCVVLIDWPEPPDGVVLIYFRGTG
ncbi:hypothetical protein [Mycolicibacter sinensis]